MSLDGSSRSLDRITGPTADREQRVEGTGTRHGPSATAKDPPRGWEGGAEGSETAATVESGGCPLLHLSPTCPPWFLPYLPPHLPWGWAPPHKPRSPVQQRPCRIACGPWLSSLHGLLPRLESVLARSHFVQQGGHPPTWPFGGSALPSPGIWGPLTWVFTCCPLPAVISHMACPSALPSPRTDRCRCGSTHLLCSPEPRSRDGRLLLTGSSCMLLRSVAV